MGGGFAIGEIARGILRAVFRLGMQHSDGRVAQAGLQLFQQFMQRVAVDMRGRRVSFTEQGGILGDESIEVPGLQRKSGYRRAERQGVEAVFQQQHQVTFRPTGPAQIHFQHIRGLGFVLQLQ